MKKKQSGSLIFVLMLIATLVSACNGSSRAQNEDKVQVLATTSTVGDVVRLRETLNWYELDAEQAAASQPA